MTGTDERSPAAAIVAALGSAAIAVDGGDRLVALNAAAAAQLGLGDAAVAVGRAARELGLPATDGIVRLPLATGDVDGAVAILAWGTPTTDAGAAIARQRTLALGRLAPGVAHDMRNHIGGLRAFAGLLRAAVGLSAEDQRMLDDVEMSVDRASRLFEAFTLLARDRAADRQAVPLAPAVHGALALTAFPMLNVTRRVTLPPDLPEVVVDVLRLHAALVAVTLTQNELLGAPAARGSIEVTARAIAGPDGALVELALEDDAPVVLGRDETPPDLAVARQLLELDRGSLRHEPGPGGGNRFLLTLRVDAAEEVERGPELAAAPGPEAAPGPAPAPELWAAPGPGAAPDPALEPGDAPALTVLVCDDEDPIRDLLARLLEREGLHTVTAASGAEGLEILDRVRVDVVMSDHRMAGMSGIELQAEIARRHPPLGRRFILMSGDPGDPDLAAFAADAGLTVLAKPFGSRSVLRDTIRDVAAR